MTTELQTRKSITVEMASRFGMEAKPFELTLKATVVPSNISNEQLAVFLMVAKKYNLDPLTKEIYAFPVKGGGIQTVVGIDGWLRMINDNQNFDGLEVEEIFDNGKIYAIKCIIYRKDRQKPTIITEYFAECYQSNKEPWKTHPIRMLRHKAIIQCARCAFGFSGIIDPEEAENITSPIDITPNNKSIYNKNLTDAILDNDNNWQNQELEIPDYPRKNSAEEYEINETKDIKGME